MEGVSEPAGGPQAQSCSQTLARVNNPAVSATCSGDTDVTTAVQGPSQPS